MGARTLFAGGLALFGLLSVADFAQTYDLVSAGGGDVYEANPVADAWLQAYGWAGLAAFKAGVVAVFAGSATLLARRRPWAGAGVVALGCAALLGVTTYSLGLQADRPGVADPGPTAGAPGSVARPLPPPPEEDREPPVLGGSAARHPSSPRGRAGDPGGRVVADHR